MQNMTGGTYFTGGNGVGIAFEACGIRDVFGVEYDDKIAQVARDNGFPVTTADVRAIDPAQLPCVDWFHASPVCKNASNAKADGEESPEDLETAQAVERYIDHHKPRVFSLENVWGYRNFKAFQDILKCLERNSYAYEYWHLNSADYGVPQTRKRLILVARRDGVKPRKPIPTHFKNPSVMLGERAWIGWYAAIEDLIDTLPPSQFAKWQLERLPKELQTVMIGGGNRSQSFLEFAKENRPDTPGKRFPEEPSHAVSATSNFDTRAFLMQVQGEGGDGIKEQAVKAFITAGGDAWSPVLGESEPLFALTASKAEHATRAYLVNESSTMETADAAQPANAQVSSAHNVNQKAYLQYGRVVKMTPRALARFQSTPNCYRFPRRARERKLTFQEKNWIASIDGKLTIAQQEYLHEYLVGNDALICKIEGNKVPPLLMQCVIGANL